MKIHELKVWKTYYKPLLSGHKKFEVRKNDRDFKVGDILILRPFDEKKQEYTTQGEFYFNVTYILDGGKFGIEEGVCVMAIEPNPAVNRNGLLEHKFNPKEFEF